VQVGPPLERFHAKKSTASVIAGNWYSKPISKSAAALADRQIR